MKTQKEVKVKPPMTASQIINETVKFYSADPVGRRAKNRNACMYKAKNGNECAYGRRWKEGVYRKKYEENSVNSLVKKYGQTPEKLLAEQYQGHNIDFWKNLQELHDEDCNWDDKGLTEEGKAEVLRLKKMWKGK